MKRKSANDNSLVPVPIFEFDDQAEPSDDFDDPFDDDIFVDDDESEDDEAFGEVVQLLRLAVETVREGADFGQLVETLAARSRLLAPELHGPIPPGEDGALAFFLARTIAQQMPNLPGRPRLEAPALPGRNEPCYCGSGRKHKSCCAGRQLPALPVPPELLWMLLVERSSGEELTALLGANQLGPKLAAQVAELLATRNQWARLQALAVLTLLSARRFDEEHHGDLLEHLTHSWDELEIDPAEQPYWPSLEAKLPPRLMAYVHRWQALELGTGEDWDAAFGLLGRAIAADPDHPANAAVEQSLHFVHGELEQGSERARFWRNRLRRGGRATDEFLATLEMAGSGALGFVQSMVAFDAPAGAIEKLDRFVAGLEGREPARYRLTLEKKKRGADSAEGELVPPPEVVPLETAWTRAMVPYHLGLGFDDEGGDRNPWSAEAAFWLPHLEKPAAPDSLVVLADLCAMILRLDMPTRALRDRWLRPLSGRALAFLEGLDGIDACQLSMEEPRHLAAARATVLRALDQLEADPGNAEILPALERCLRWDPEDYLEIAPTVIGLLVDAGRDQDVLTKIEEYGDGEIEPDFVWNKTLALYRLGRLDEATTCLEEEALENDPEVATLLLVGEEDAEADTEAHALAYVRERGQAWRDAPGALAWLAPAFQAWLDADLDPEDGVSRI